MTFLGLLAGIFTTTSWLPQAVRSWRTRSTRDFSWPYLVVYTTGVVLWIVYGLVRDDLAVLSTNLVTLCLLIFMISLKLGEDRRRARST